MLRGRVLTCLLTAACAAGVAGQELAPGSYRLQATPTASKITGKPVTLTFRIRG